MPEFRFFLMPLDILHLLLFEIPSKYYLFNVNNKNTRKKYEICPKFCRSGVFIANFEHISHFCLVLMTLNR